ncbi:protein kinase [Nonomuraea sp. MCN248]|uniref:non-specific serine/threonine protein kinase n=1 Tax=Nonomuraea corallina TaxID=2989783 RepID=A0ABT4SHX9_9ACTN|nr:serine/threonine-protein kinase [Nonomuraea corallina]MDA0636739.1 protein kinase [Nonomuraea corallina]
MEWSAPGYTEIRQLGAGAGGRVVLAVHEETGVKVAIKYLSERWRHDPAALDRFRSEARLLTTLRDPNVATLWEYIQDPQGAAIVMELVNGVPLRALLRESGATGPEAALVVLKGSLLGLARAHALGLVHRDYKPENVIVREDGHSKLVDFGIAVRQGQATRAEGTPPYMAPELWAGEPASPATDVYAATAVFFECLTGHRPYRSSEPTVLGYQHLHAPVPAHDAPEPVRGLILRGLAKDPADRPAGAEAFVAELERVARAAYGEDWEERGRRRLAGLVLLLALLLPEPAEPAPQVTTTLAHTVFKGVRGKAVRVAMAGGLAAVVAAGVVVVAVNRETPTRLNPVAAAPSEPPAVTPSPEPERTPEESPEPATSPTGEPSDQALGRLPTVDGTAQPTPGTTGVPDLATTGFSDPRVTTTGTSTSTPTSPAPETTGPPTTGPPTTSPPTTGPPTSQPPTSQPPTSPAGTPTVTPTTGTPTPTTGTPTTGTPTPSDPVTSAPPETAVSSLSVSRLSVRGARATGAFALDATGTGPVTVRATWLVAGESVRSERLRLGDARSYTRSLAHDLGERPCGRSVTLTVVSDPPARGGNATATVNVPPCPTEATGLRVRLAMAGGTAAATVSLRTSGTGQVPVTAAFAVDGDQVATRAANVSGRTSYLRTFRHAFRARPCGSTVTVRVTAGERTAAARATVVCPIEVKSVSVVRAVAVRGALTTTVAVTTGDARPVRLVVGFYQAGRLAGTRQLTLSGATSYTRTLRHPVEAACGTSWLVRASTRPGAGNGVSQRDGRLPACEPEVTETPQPQIN